MTGLLSKVQRKPTSKMGQRELGGLSRPSGRSRQTEERTVPGRPHPQSRLVFLIQSPAADESPRRQGLGQALLRPGSRALLSALQGGGVCWRGSGQEERRGDKRYPQAEDAAENWMGSQER